MAQFNRHPIRNHGAIDERYSIELVWCGYETQRYVAYFCDEWIGQSLGYGGALMLASGHNARRNGALVFEEVAP